MSARSKNAWPANRGSTLGKQIDASVQLSAMSWSRSGRFQQPGRISSKVTGVLSRSGNPMAAERRGNG